MFVAFVFFFDFRYSVLCTFCEATSSKGTRSAQQDGGGALRHRIAIAPRSSIVSDLDACQAQLNAERV